MTVNKAYKFRAYPNSEQETMFLKTFGCVRAIYNMMLHDKIAHYEEFHSMLDNTPAQYKTRYQWLKDVDAYALCNAQINLQNAYRKFFNNKSVGFPKYKTKKSRKNSYTTNNVKNSIRIDGSKIRLPKVGFIKIKLHRQIPQSHKIKSCTVSMSLSGKFYMSVLTEYDCDNPNLNLDVNKSLGLDYSSPHFYVDSQGNEADYPKFYRNGEEKISREQRKLSKMMPGSSNYLKQKRRVANIHEHVANQRRDWLHKKSKELSESWDYIFVEDINLRGMAGSLRLGKATNDNGFGMFRNFLSYKMADRGKIFMAVDRWFPSSKMCHECGYINKGLTLSDREWVCQCGIHHIRDINAALNIRDAGIKMLTA